MIYGQRNIKLKDVQKIKTRFCSINSSPKVVPFLHNVGRYGRATQATDDKIIRRMPIAYYVTKVTDKHSDYFTLIAFPWQKLYRGSVKVTCIYIIFLSCFLFSRIENPIESLNLYTILVRICNELK
jgi:hypothetical protein